MFQWYDRYNVGHDEIDSDHKYLFNLINAFHRAVAEGLGEAEMQTTLEGLMSYTRFHFAREEGYMLEKGYEEYARHKAMHEDLLAQLEELRRRFEAGDRMVGIELSTFLTDWLVNHIMKTDTRLAAFLTA